MPELLNSTERLLAVYQNWQKSTQYKENRATIHVDEVASKVASFYEKLREVVDWREEHLLRKTAIERMLKRRFFLNKNGKDIAEPLIYELIRGGRFENDSIPESKIEEVRESINKYSYIIENASKAAKDRMHAHFYDWLLSVAACEIEEILSPPLRQEALIDFMFGQMKEKIEIRRLQISEDEKNTQIYIAVQKALFKLDPPLISYNLLKKWYPDWLHLSQERLAAVTNNIYGIWKKIDGNMNHPLADRFYEVCERMDTPYLILGDVIGSDPKTAQESLATPKALEGKIREAYDSRLKRAKARMGRAAVYATLSIFITKMLLALSIEIPVDKYITGQFSYFTTSLNILIPPLLMYFLVLSIRPPSKRNEELVVMDVMKITYEREKKDVYSIEPPRKRSLAFSIIIGLVYMLSFAATFGAIFWILEKLRFSVVSIAIFIVFISLISFAGVKIRKRANELVVERKKETFLMSLFDLFSLPIIQVGRWLSNQWTKYNALAVLFSSLLDMPFQLFIEFIEQWRQFLKEKKGKIY